MEIDFKSLLKKEWWLGMSRKAKGRLFHLPKWLLLQHGHAFDVVVVVLVIFFAFLLIVKALYFQPTALISTSEEKTLLSTSLIDKIIVWIEERKVEGEKVFEIPEGIFKSYL